VSDPSSTFTRALVREPSESAVEGLRDVDVGPPDIERFHRDHADYHVAALEAAGVAVTVLPALESHPEPTADAIRVNDRVLLPAAGHRCTAARLVAAGYRVHEVGNAEGAKLDGGMSRLSLRFDIAEGAAR